MFSSFLFRTILCILLTAVACLLPCTASASASDSPTLVNLSIRVVDSVTGRGLSDCEVTLHPTGTRSTTDKLGFAFFQSVLPGEYQVSISGPGFASPDLYHILQREHQPQSLTIRVTVPRSLSDSIIVHGRRSVDGDMTLISQSELRQSSAHSVSEVLRTQSGIVIRENRNGDALLSINGSEPRHVRILLNGQPIQQNSDGSANLSTIPMTSVKEIRITKGTAASASVPGALGGSIDIRTVIHGLLDNSRARITTTHGDWNSERYLAHSTISDHSARLSASIDWQLQRQSGDFPYEYAVLPSPTTFSGTRANNDFLNRIVSGSASYRDFSFIVSNAESERGLPDRASSQNMHARTIDTRFHTSALWSRAIAAQTELKASLSYQESTNRAVDTVTLPIPSRFDSQYETRITQGHALLAQDVSDNSKLTVSLEGSVERLEHNDAFRTGASLGNADRKQFGSSMTLADHRKLPSIFFFNDLSSTVGVRYDNIASRSLRDDSALSSLTNQISPSIQITLRRDGIIVPRVSAGYGSNWSAPSLTSLFWRRDARSEGNPSLKPEQAEGFHTEIGISAEFGFAQLDASARWHQTDYTDLVIWRPDFRGLFRPVNLAESRISGRSDQATIYFLKRTVSFLYTNDLVDPRNRTTGIDFEKQLTFRPRYVTRVAGNAQTKHWDMNLSHEIVARRFATESNTRWYDSYHVTDLSAGITIGSSPLACRIGGELRNLFDQSYAQIAHYPMPGRNFEFSIRLTFNPTDSNKK